MGKKISNKNLYFYYGDYFSFNSSILPTRNLIIVRGNEVAQKLRNALSAIGAMNTDALDNNNLSPHLLVHN